MKEERRALEDLYKRAMQKAEYLPFIKKHSDCYSVDHKKTLKNWNMMTLINKFWFLQFDPEKFRKVTGRHFVLF